MYCGWSDARARALRACVCVLALACLRLRACTCVLALACLRLRVCACVFACLRLRACACVLALACLRLIACACVLALACLRLRACVLALACLRLRACACVLALALACLRLRACVLACLRLRACACVLSLACLRLRASKPNYKPERARVSARVRPKRNGLGLRFRPVRVSAFVAGGSGCRNGASNARATPAPVPRGSTESTSSSVGGSAAAVARTATPPNPHARKAAACWRAYSCLPIVAASACHIELATQASRFRACLNGPNTCET